MTANKHTADTEWTRIWPHKWKHPEGWIIQRMWTIGVKKKDFFLCYWSEDDYYKGNNFLSKTTLKEAKKSFTDD